MEKDFLRPMKAVLRRHLQGRPQQLRIVVYGQGFPITFRVPRGTLAMFDPDDDFFMVDLPELLKLRPPALPRYQWIAFVIAHEVRHLVQPGPCAMLSFTGWLFTIAGCGDDPLESVGGHEGRHAAGA